MPENLKELSDRATPGDWSVFDTRGIVEIQAGEQKPVVHWSGFDQSASSLLRQRLDARLMVGLVNAYRSGRLHDDTALATAVARARREALEEAAALVETEKMGWSATGRIVLNCAAIAIRALAAASPKARQTETNQ